ncbi:ATP-binding protein [Mucilaginibacter glaciei]|uniref:histidine kinase n=1 Tax=Mucilaginibacter glaciei TaxID=2772109 RepID=A0A926NU55_9SPHI|nr:ATP-binding protein [Mucilaginibacter glaciei]MBD1394657.1 PAS domain-containing protein [Mucilaginibacter glaciei]
MTLTSRWKFIWPYVILIMTILFMVSLDSRLISNSIKEHKTYARTINLAGRQRMLSQKIINGLLLAGLNDTSRKQLIQDLHDWDKMHTSLQHGDDVNGLMNLDDTPLINLFYAINPSQQKLYKEVVKLSDTINGGIQKRPLDIAVIKNAIRLQKDYLAKMDHIVFATDKYVEQKLTKAADDEMLAALISGVILLLEILLIVYPYHRKANRDYDKIKIQSQEIEDQKEEIIQQMDLLSQQNLTLDNLQRTQKLTLDAINAGVWEWDIITNMQQWSGKFYQLLGYQPDEIPASFDAFVNELLHPDEKAKLDEAIKNHLAKHTLYQLNVRLLNKNGTYRWYETSGKAERNADNIPTRMAGSIIDINDKVTYERQLEISNATKDKLLAILSHDLRAPIGSLKSLVDWHREDYISDEEFKESLQKIKTTVTNLSGSLDNILQWAMSQIGGFKTNPQNTGIEDVLILVWNLLKETADDKGITMHCKLLKDGVVYVDQNHLFLVLRNLISNAIKFTPSGGRIDIMDFVKDDHVYIKITDSGKGMTAEQIALIFENNQISSTPGTKGEMGSGLGLSIAFDMLKRNKGVLEITSEVTKGSSFIVVIPKAEAV